MAQWGNKDEANSAPLFVVDATTGRTGVQEYGNTVFGIDPAEAVAGAGSPGWVREILGTGKVVDVKLIDGGIDYANTDTIEVGDDTGTITTDANGTITSISITYQGNEVDEVPEVEVVTEDGAGAEFEVVTEGRVGRVTVETLVAMRGITN